MLQISAIDPTSQPILQVLSEDLTIEDYAFTGDIKEVWYNILIV